MFYGYLLNDGGETCMEKKNALGIDWGYKRLGLAYFQVDTTIISPIGYIENDESLIFNVAGMLQRYYIKDVVVGYPKKHESSQKKIDSLLEQLSYLDPDLEFYKVDEEYSSVQANARVGAYHKDMREDAIAAMIILENRMAQK